jgi:hypothetical protein
MGFIDLLWPGMLLAEHKSGGASLDAAMSQALDYVDGLDNKDLPRLVIVSNFARMRILDLEDDERRSFELDLLDLPKEIDRLLVLAGYSRRRLTPEPKANADAAELLARVYDEIDTSGYDEHSLRVFMVRVLFVLFADDTGLWQRDQFSDLLRDRTAEDGSDLGMWIARLFSVLDKSEAKRTSTLDEDLASFPHVNGSVFSEPLDPPDTTRSMRERLLEATAFDWSQISPAVFGSIFQSVMDPSSRRELGAHYTSEEHILKLIEPLFLDELKSELNACGRSKRKLREFHLHLGQLGLLDPACGCGNFLVVAYRELRKLELEVLKRLHPGDIQMTTDLRDWRQVSPRQFAGIELEEFPARIAETAMYLVDHQANEDLGRHFGVPVVELPLPPGAQIEVGNALAVEWATVLPPDSCTHVLGNPPYAGKHLLNTEQRADLERVLGPHTSPGSLDYVSAWFVKAANYMANNSDIRAAFVATNSITQGEQVPHLWPVLHRLGVHITFAWRTFNWTSEARGAAHVHVVIIGFRRLEQPESATLHEFDPDSVASLERRVPALNGYLIAGAEIYPAGRSRPLADETPPITYGAKPADGGSLLLTTEEASAIRRNDPVAANYVRPMLSATEFLNGKERFCLWLTDANPSDMRASSTLRARLAAVRAFREDSTKQKTREMADLPGLFAEVRRPKGGFVFVPRHASAGRHLIPMGFVTPELEAVVHDSGAYVEEADLAHFGLLQSEMFAAWQRTVGGRIKSDYRFNNRLVYNTFPFPSLSSAQRKRIAAFAQAILDARAAHPDASLADLYSPIGAPANLVKAHRDLDKAVDAFFSRRKRLSEADRLSLLFSRYVELTQPNSNLGTEQGIAM